jgi:energy-coupling factor transporter ATP-binding protein EcfA2
MWRQGEHVAVIGMTGSGKTTLARRLLEHRKYRVMLVTKPDDVQWDGYQQVSDAASIDAAKGRAWRLWPPIDHDASRAQFRAALDRAWHEGGWTLYLDELYHLEHLGLRNAVIQHLTQGRSKNVTVVAGVQRPAWVTKFAFSETTHCFVFKMGNDEDLAAIGKQIGKAFARQVDALPRFHFAYLNKITGVIRTGSIKTLDEVLK